VAATIKDLYKRSIVDKYSGCWHWQGATRKDGLPSIWTLDYEKVKKRTMAGPRAVWMIANGSAPKGVVYRCCARDCVNPKHMRVAKDREAMTAAVAKAGKFRSPKMHAARLINLRHARKAQGIVDTPDHHVMAIRASSEPLAVLAERFGISDHAVSEIRRGKSRLGVAMNSERDAA
jgi:hypothetical protein